MRLLSAARRGAAVIRLQAFEEQLRHEAASLLVCRISQHRDQRFRLQLVQLLRRKVREPDERSQLLQRALSLLLD